jgi:ribosomal protein S17E
LGKRLENDFWQNMKIIIDVINVDSAEILSRVEGTHTHTHARAHAHAHAHTHTHTHTHTYTHVYKCIY